MTNTVSLKQSSRSIASIFSWAIAVFFAPLHTAAIVIDDFSTGILNIDDIQEVTQTNLPTSNTIGGVRTVSVATREFDFADITLAINSGSPTLKYQSSSSSDPTILHLQYGSSTPLNADFTDDGINNQLEFDYENFNGGFFGIATPRFTMTSTNGSAFGIFSKDQANTNRSGKYYFLFDDVNASNNFDFSSVDSFTLMLPSIPGGQDFSINSIRAVPEPSSLLFFLACMPIMLRRTDNNRA